MADEFLQRATPNVAHTKRFLEVWAADPKFRRELAEDADAARGSVVPRAISPDGGMLLFDNRITPSDGGILALDTLEPEMLLMSPANEFMGDFSPDGRFFAFMSNETGQYEVSVMEVSSGRTFLVSTSTRGGSVPRWSRDGREIYYGSVNGPGILVAEWMWSRFPHPSLSKSRTSAGVAFPTLL